ncbi:MAG: phosphatase PAP2 family protein [Anaerolineales bacterium]|nr:phosphatase PAP2 family protein [Anaerolineales bacterium]
METSKMPDKIPIEKITEMAHQSARTASASTLLRRYRAVLFQTALIFVASAFAVLTYYVKTMPSFAIDLQITKAIQLINFPFFASFMNLVSWPGFGPQLIVITALIVLLIYSFGLHWESVMAFVAASFSTGSNLIVKDLIQRPRPTSNLVNVFAKLTDSSFPSGHVMFYIGFYGFIGFLAFSLLKPSLKRNFLLAFFGGLVVLIGASRIYLGQHWASDVLGAYLLGSLTLEAYIRIYLWGKTRFFVHQPVVTAES